MEESKENKIHRLAFRVTEAEHQEIKRRMAEKGIESKTDFILGCVLDKQVRVIKTDQTKIKSYAKLAAIHDRIKKIGHNINQSVKVINSYAKNHELSNEFFALKSHLQEARGVLEKNTKIIAEIGDSFI